MTDPDVLAVIRFYPQIYLACHVEHRSRSQSPTGLTAREAGILAHVDESEGTSRRGWRGISASRPRPCRRRWPGWRGRACWRWTPTRATRGGAGCD
jgi:hypothetical protein